MMGKIGGIQFALFDIQKKIYIFICFIVLSLGESLSASRPLVLVVVGPPGSGKGYLATRIVGDGPNRVHISAGDLLREQVNQETEVGRLIAGIVRNGDPVPNAIIHPLIRDKFTEALAQNRLVIMDGFGGQSREDVPFFRDLLNEINLGDRVMVVCLNSTNEACQRRMVTRIICNNCARVYNLNTCPPQTPGVCDVCRTPLSERPQDNVGTIRARLVRFREVMAPNYAQFQQFFHWMTLDVDLEDRDQQIQRFLDALNDWPEGAYPDWVHAPGL
ncbi:MAG: nucleoside monophosphate kinase [Holosporales bacterium]|nr:nucleoside monophosphate kinase [Holosporales bacterium]